MTKEQANNMLKFLKDYYEKNNLDKEKVYSFYKDTLVSLKYEHMRKALQTLAKEVNYFPKISVVMQYYNAEQHERFGFFIFIVYTHYQVEYSL